MKQLVSCYVLLALVASLMIGCAGPQPADVDAEEASVEVQEEAIAAPTETPIPTSTPLPVFNPGGTWEAGSTMPNPRDRMPAIPIEELIYIPGGESGKEIFEAYNPADDTWTTLADLPVGLLDPMAAVYDSRLYLMGGHESFADTRGTTKLWIYDPATDTWSELTHMPETRWAGDAVTLGNYIYIVGGIGPTGDLLRYEVATDTWTALPGLVAPVWGLQAVVLDDKIWVIGGSTTPDYQSVDALGDVRIYDPATESWEEGPPLVQPRAYFMAEAYGRNIVVTGGLAVMWSQLPTTTEVYDPDQGEWLAGSDLPNASWASGSAIVGDQIFLFGGRDSRNISDRIVVYSP
jgi:N-acetylneuraminic acid mutarotase